MNQNHEQILQKMTLEEKVLMLAGVDMWHTHPFRHLNIPAAKVTDGPSGARGSDGNFGPTSASFPAGVALGATWNPDLVREVGAALAQETRSKGAHILLAPTVNIHRSPLAGRNFECYSEDPYLTGRLAAAYIHGLQSQGVGACIKHFVANDSEFERMSISSEVRPRALHEIYLEPFRLALKEAQPWTIMSAYNRLNGVYASENSWLLQDLLKEKWGFDGVVISDWHGTYSDAAAGGGLDLEMPGPGRWMGPNLLDMVATGELDEAVIDDKVRRLLLLIERCTAFEEQEAAPEQAVDRPEHRRLIRRAASEAIVLLKNEDNLLPLTANAPQTIAVIGENAYRTQNQGGGSVHVNPHYLISPLQGIKEAVGANMQLLHHPGCQIHRTPPSPPVDWLHDSNGQAGGLTVELFDNQELREEPVFQGLTSRTGFSWSSHVDAYVDPRRCSLRLSGTLTVPDSGIYKLHTMSIGRTRLYIDEQLALDNWAPPQEPGEMRQATAELNLAAGDSCRLRFEYTSLPGPRWRMVHLGCLPPQPADPIPEAAALAAKADVAIIFAGLTDEWEGEGADRRDMNLPGQQDRLIEEVAAANPNTIVVLNGGAPLHMPWLDRVSALLQSWYLGQETGHAIADIIFGRTNPSGRLPTTFPRRIEDNPAFINYPGENGRVYYGEDIFVGYRYYEKKKIAPLFPFGHGLSYTTFTYSDLALSADEFAAGETIHGTITIKNSGSRPGQEVIQIYLRDLESSLTRPKKELKAFAKIYLGAGEQREVAFQLSEQSLAFYDPQAESWKTEAGEFEILVGSSSAAIHCRKSFTWHEKKED